jgi:hypothetical protein
MGDSLSHAFLPEFTMLTLDLTNTPRWHDLASGVRVQLGPLTTARMVTSRSDPEVENLSDTASNEERALARRAMLVKKGVGDAEGSPSTRSTATSSMSCARSAERHGQVSATVGSSSCANGISGCAGLRPKRLAKSPRGSGHDLRAEQVAPLVRQASRLIQAHLDATAQERGYFDALACVSYRGDEEEPVWAAEAEAFHRWRTRVWRIAHQLLAEVEAGAAVPPADEAEPFERLGLPPLTWP